MECLAARQAILYCSHEIKTMATENNQYQGLHQTAFNLFTVHHFIEGKPVLWLNQSFITTKPVVL